MCIEKYFNWWVEHWITSIISGFLIPIIINSLWTAVIGIIKYSFASALVLIIAIVMLALGPYYGIGIKIKVFIEESNLSFQ